LDKKRPVNLDIGTIQLPVTAYVSILHRVSGVVLFGAVGLFLWILDSSLSTEQDFISIKEFMNNFVVSNYNLAFISCFGISLGGWFKTSYYGLWLWRRNPKWVEFWGPS
jgi:succinate dehydrogenase cytochrome b556 subunit